MKKILLCDANFCVLPILESITNKGFNLSVVGAKYDDPAHILADGSIDLDYSNVEALYEHALQSKYIGIVPGCNDQSYLSASYVAGQLKLPGFDPYETALTIHHKDKFRKFSEQKNYPIPKAFNSIRDITPSNFPLLVKPVDSFSGKGINKANNIEELQGYWQEALKFSSSGSVIAEVFLEGDLYSHSVFIKNKKIVADFFVNEYCTVYPYQVNSSNLSSVLNVKIKHALKQWVEKFSVDLDLCDGLVHTQFITNGEDFHLIEVTRRCPGDLYSQLIEKSTGINYAELYALPFCNLEIPEKISIQAPKYITRHTVSLNHDCIFIGSALKLNCLSSLSIPLKNSGEEMKAAPFGKSAIYFIEHENHLEMESLTEKMKDFITVEYLDIAHKSSNF